MTISDSWSGEDACFVNSNDNACHTDGTNYFVQQEGGTNWTKDTGSLTKNKNVCMLTCMPELC